MSEPADNIDLIRHVNEDSPLNDKELLSADLVVVDEFSMVDMRLAYLLHLLARGVPYDQLPWL